MLIENGAKVREPSLTYILKVALHYNASFETINLLIGYGAGAGAGVDEDILDDYHKYRRITMRNHASSISYPSLEIINLLVKNGAKVKDGN